MSIPNIRIINKTGHARDTEIIAGDAPVIGVTEIIIKPIKPGQMIEAIITVMVKELEMQSEKFLFIGEVMEQQTDPDPSATFVTKMKLEYEFISDNYGEALISEVYRRSEYNEGKTKVILELIKGKLEEHGRMQPETLKEYLNLFF